MAIVIASIWFQLLWFVAVLGQGRFQRVLLVAVVLTWVWQFRKSGIRQRWLGILLLGIGVDLGNQLSGLFVFAEPLFPLWLMALWGAFSWYCHYLMSFLKRWSWHSVVLIGGIAGVTSYYAGEVLNAVVFPYSNNVTLLVLFIEWALISYVLWRLEHQP